VDFLPHRRRAHRRGHRNRGERDATNPKIPIVKVKVGKRLSQPKTLAVIKAEPLFAESPLVVIGRLS